MGEIKSALEIALERTRDIPSDPVALRRQAARTEGKKLFAQLRQEEGFDLAAALKGVAKDDLPWVKEGLVEVIRSNLTLPQTDGDIQTLDLLHRALQPLVSNSGVLKELFKQTREFFSRYLEDRKGLIEELQRQFEPRLRQREQQMAQQYGRPVKLDPATDPEFTQVLQNHMGQLEGQYRQALTQIIAHIDQLVAPK